MTCLPSSAERSRTRRGNAPNKCSIRCMRIRVAASRTSLRIVVIRSKGPSMVGSVPASRRRCARSLRARTMSETPLITRSRSSTGRRIVRATPFELSALGLSVFTASTASSGEDSIASSTLSSAAISSSSPPSANSSPASMASTISAILSMIARTAVTSAESAVRRPARTSDRASSAPWLSFSRRGKSKKPQFPLTV